MRLFFLVTLSSMTWSQTKKACTLGFTTSDILQLYGSPAPCQNGCVFQQEARIAQVAALMIVGSEQAKIEAGGLWGSIIRIIRLWPRRRGFPLHCQTG